VTLSSLLSGDKYPLLIAVGLTIFGWYVDSISRYFTDQTIIYVVTKTAVESDEYLIRNVSLNKSVKNASIQIQCVPTPDCLASLSDSTFGTVEQVAPFAAEGNQACFQNANSYQAEVSLPPGASARIIVHKKSGGKTELFLAGSFERTCQDLRPTEIRVEQYPSWIAILLENFILYYFISIVVLILVFLFTLWRLISTPVPDEMEGGEHAAQALTINVTMHGDRQPRAEPGA
jgi:hypothetical protein